MLVDWFFIDNSYLSTILATMLEKDIQDWMYEKIWFKAQIKHYILISQGLC